MSFRPRRPDMPPPWPPFIPPFDTPGSEPPPLPPEADSARGFEYRRQHLEFRIKTRLVARRLAVAA